MAPPACVYLDHNATTPTDARVVAAMLPYFTAHFANPSSKHALGMNAAGAVQQARRAVQKLIGAARPDEIVFTSGGTEADNLALRAGIEIGLAHGRDELVVSAVEHPAVLTLCDHMRATRNLVVHRIGVDAQGRIDRDAYRRMLGPRTALVSVMWANNETGTIFPIAELAAEARACGALFHTDAVQAAGRVPLAVATLAVDLLSLSAHKFHGPKGVGALYIRHGLKLSPLIHGGRQERGMRAGTENVPAIVGCGVAAAQAEAEAVDPAPLRDRLAHGITTLIPEALVLGDPEHRLANTLCVAFANITADDAVTLLSKASIHVSSGSACSSGSHEPSHVLRAMRVPFPYLHGALRFSLGRDTTAAEIVRVLDVLPGVIATLRAANAELEPTARTAGVA